MFKIRMALMVLLMLAVAGSVPATAVQKEFQVSAGGTLVLDLEAGGDVTVTGGSNGTAVISINQDGPDQSNVEIDARLEGSRLVVSSGYREHKKMQRSNITIEVSLPYLFDIELDSMGGGLTVNGLEGTIAGKTMGGELVLDNVIGELALTTMGGEISLTNSEVDGRITTMGGEVLLEDVIGDVEATSMGGEVILRNVTRRDGSSTGEMVKISTMGGGITVDDAPAGADVHTMGGDIIIESVYEFAKVKTMGGDILIRAADGPVDATTMGGDVRVTVIGGMGGDVTLVSMSGEVHLTVPPGFPMDIDIELEYTKKSARNYKVISDVPLEQSESPEWDHSRGSPCKTIHATGTANGGGNRVMLSTVNGNIYLHQGS